MRRYICEQYDKCSIGILQTLLSSAFFEGDRVMQKNMTVWNKNNSKTIFTMCFQQNEVRINTFCIHHLLFKNYITKMTSVLLYTLFYSWNAFSPLLGTPPSPYCHSFFFNVLFQCSNSPRAIHSSWGTSRQIKISCKPFNISIPWNYKYWEYLLQNI